ISLQPAKDACKAVLEYAGAILPVRDTLDQRIINDVINRTGRFIDVQGGHLHGTAYEQTTSAWPHLQQQPPLTDTDRDGMPDEWEIKNNLNAKDASDTSAYTLSRDYTNIEIYINELANK